MTDIRKKSRASEYELTPELLRDALWGAAITFAVLVLLALGIYLLLNVELPTWSEALNRTDYIGRALQYVSNPSKLLTEVVFGKP